MYSGIKYNPNYFKLTINSNTMNTVTVSKADLIKVLTENRDKHQTEYNEAYEGYKLLVIKALNEKLELVKSGEKFDMYFNELQGAPDCHVDEYQNVIDMLSVTSDLDVQITMTDYLMYYKNNWSWRSGWHLSNKSYMDAYYASSNV